MEVHPRNAEEKTTLRVLVTGANRYVVIPREVSFLMTYNTQWSGLRDMLSYDRRVSHDAATVTDTPPNLFHT